MVGKKIAKVVEDYFLIGRKVSFFQKKIKLKNVFFFMNEYRKIVFAIMKKISDFFVQILARSYSRPENETNFKRNGNFEQRGATSNLVSQGE